MNSPPCAVCDSALGEPAYISPGERSLTSLCRIHPAAATVYICEACSHLQTPAISNVAAYYDEHYDILVDSEEEDQIYEVLDGQPVYRTEHQAGVLVEKLGFTHETLLLDYGCAKSSTIRMLCTTHHQVTPYLFDVSARYVPFWKKFAAPEHWAVNETRPEWAARFDVVTSFFSLEHIPSVAATLREIAGLLRPGGIFYAVVPNVLSNIADFIVVDHCNHFTRASLKRLLDDAGFALQEIDELAHRGALVVIARKPTGHASSASNASESEIQRTCSDLMQLAAFWREAGDRIREHEASLAADSKAAIYGGGFYGTFISTNLVHAERIICHIDQNPFLIGKSVNGCPILLPENLPPDVDTLFVGINPAHARAIISDIPALARRNLSYFFL